MEWLAWAAALLLGGLAGYTLVPDLLVHRLGMGAWTRHYGPGVALTFDDGPDAHITPAVLDVLRRHGVKATFFLVGERAARHPGLVRRMVAEGHRLGAHSHRHRYPWFVSPWATWRDWEESVATIEAISGRPVEWVRPPWGTLNLATWAWVRARRRKLVLWNVEAHDWLVGRGPQRVADEVVRKARDGAIVLLHDAGGQPGAPANTLRALDDLCHRVRQERKLALVLPDLPDWTLRRRLLFAAWEGWERVFARLYQVERLDATNIFRLGLSRYRGPELRGADGSVAARSGDLVGEIHLDSLRLQDRGADAQRSAARLLREARESMRGLARHVASDPRFADVQVLLGYTLLQAHARALGFHVQEMPPGWAPGLLGRWERLVMWVYRPTGRPPAGRHLRARPELAWISRAELLERWLPQASPAEEGAGA
ncbi:MAG: polysaccharide deacetylase family protein [Syntrophomonadaceae bacterium]|nr:polysaccharide deacetylase family protein [Syntrophomonadaceae bacterium]MDH7498538.1 polysaccharide deacetylase family protein [Syntrophomonadaceae bacterium]